MKILHSADWHLDSPLQGHTPEQTVLLRKALLAVPGKIAQLCRNERCDMMLLSGDLFDGPYTVDSLNALKEALTEAAVPVFIAPGNHDFLGADSPWLTQSWPENVHIFTQPVLTSVEGPGCTVYGAGFTSMDCLGLLEDFHADEKPALCVLHGDPTQVNSPYCPITRKQAEDSGLTYLALGHIHKGGQFQAGNTFCAWPGCPMGRGYDEQGEKGVLIVTIEDSVSARFVALDTPHFYDLECAPEALAQSLPAVGSEDFYRVTLTGESEPVELHALYSQYTRFPNLELRDKTVRPVDPWLSAGEDSFEGTYFRLLQEALEGQDEQTQKRIRLAARISRKLLDGQEVVLP